MSQKIRGERQTYTQRTPPPQVRATLKLLKNVPLSISYTSILYRIVCLEFQKKICEVNLRLRLTPKNQLLENKLKNNLFFLDI